jgi:hypothetical protein
MYPDKGAAPRSVATNMTSNRGFHVRLHKYVAGGGVAQGHGLS